MANIKSRDTTPEKQVLGVLNGLGFKYARHDSRLPGKPDFVFSRRKKVIFVNGCFWHLHRCRYGMVKPKTRAIFWKTKREATRKRDIRKLRQLRKMGWDTLVIWQCRLKNSDRIAMVVRRFLRNKAVPGR